MYLIAVIMVLSALVAWVVAALVCKYADKLNVLQIPNHRSSHVNPTPSAGGLGVVIAGSLAALCLGIFYGWSDNWFVVGLGGLLAAVGFQDDIRHVTARFRFGTQVIVCIGLLIVIGDLPPITLNIGVELKITGWILSVMLLIAGVWWVNIFNFMDGIDGIAGAQAIYMLLSGAVIAEYTNYDAIFSPVWILMLCIVAATVGFLMLNWPPAKIFMGDVGSTWLAFMVFALALLSVQYGWLNYAQWVILAAVFVTDATVTLLTRMLRGERWYEAHDTHTYQLLARRWDGDKRSGHRLVTLLGAVVNLLWLFPWAWACSLWPDGTMWFVLTAYLPLVFAEYQVGCGRPQNYVPHPRR